MRGRSGVPSGGMASLDIETPDEQRSSLENPSQWLTDALIDGPQSYAGKPVSVPTSLKLVPVYSAVSLLAGAVGSLPLIVYGKDRERDRLSAEWRLLHDAPNPSMAADEVWELVMAHLCTWGNAYLFKIKDDVGRVVELWPLAPGTVKVTRAANGTHRYKRNGEQRTLTDRDILHIRGLGDDGTIGYSPISQARQMLGTSLAQEEYAGRFWANDATPGVALIHPGKLNPEGIERLRGLWNNRHKGVQNARGTAVLGEDIKIQQVGLPLADAQFVEQAKLARTDVALLFRIPPHMLAGETGDSLTYSTTEGQALDFVRWTLRRWLVRIENALRRDPDLLAESQYCEFLTDGLLRASAVERATIYQRALDPTRGWMTQAEVRARENLPPLDLPAVPVKAGT